ncbi:MAG TPA: DUF1003 domain-containing protein [Ilumatobacteraceae bacterium]|nr:DUF1003 domain-containing protein [Ilumatobacteraceae bacterium]
MADNEPQNDSASAEEAHHLDCPACRVIDRADGVEDGHLGNPAHYSTASSRDLFALMRRLQDHTADTITSFAGSMRFVYIHLAWFGAWIAINVGLAGIDHEFDKFPFGLLTMIVSLEAIFLATFVMISQNRQAARSDLRTQLDFENNIRAEIWSVHIGQTLGLDADHVEDVVRRAIAGAEAAMRTATPNGK